MVDTRPHVAFPIATRPTHRTTPLCVVYLGSGAASALLACRDIIGTLTPVGFEPTQLALVELESTPLDHSGKVS